MDAQALIFLAQILLMLIFVLVSVNLYLLFKLKDIDPFRSWNRDSINGGLFMALWVVGVIVSGVASYVWWDEMIMVHSAVSDQGLRIDGMFWRTMVISIIVTLLTNTLLFYFSWKYRNKKGQKAFHYAHNNRLEFIWTIIPAITLTILVIDGVAAWHDIMGDVPEEAVEIELNAKQFDWTIRYPGADLEFGEAHVKYINEATANQLGFNFEDRNGHDDIVATELHMPVDHPVKFTIKSRDVIHSATLVHFRMKMDAVPGMATHFWVTPNKTTAEMRKDLGDDNFNYELSCQQICGASHWNMRRIVVVETMEEYQAWLASQQPFYAQWQQMNGGATTASTENLSNEQLDVAISVNP